MNQFQSKLALNALIILFLAVFNSSSIQAKDSINPHSDLSNQSPEWKNLSKKELGTKLKTYAYAKLRLSMKSSLDYSEEREIFYSPCPENFPQLEGDFPCNLLEWSDTLTAENRSSSNEYREGGVITIYISTNKSKLVNGQSILISSQEKNSISNPSKKIKEILPSDIQIFYNSQNKISHYRIGNKAVLFSWKKEAGNDTLKSILELNLNSELWIESGREIDFSH